MDNGAQQLSFDFGERWPGTWRRADNLFFAALPTPDAARRIAAVAATLRKTRGLTGRLRPARLLHVSLAGVGEFARLPEAVVAAAMQAGSIVRLAPFEVRVTHAMSFDGRLRPGQRRPIVLRCDRGEREFIHLRRSISDAMQWVRLSRGLAAGFVPHVTLLYDEEQLADTSLLEPISWTVREFVLVQSLVGRGQHVQLARWQLG